MGEYFIIVVLMCELIDWLCSWYCFWLCDDIDDFDYYMVGVSFVDFVCDYVGLCSLILGIEL